MKEMTAEMIKEPPKAEIHLHDTTLRDSFRILFRRKAVIMLCTFLVPFTVYMGLQMRTPVYEASVKMLVTGEQTAGAVYYKDLVSQRNTEASLTRAETVKSVPVLRMVANALRLHELPLDYEKQFASPLKKMMIDIDTKKVTEKLNQLDEKSRQVLLYRKAIQDLRKKINVETIRSTNLFTIKVWDYDANKSAKLVNAIGMAYMVVDLQQQLSEMNLKYGERHPMIRQLNDNIALIKNNLTDPSLGDELTFQPATVKPIERAIPSPTPVGPDRRLLLLGSVLIGMLVGFSLALVLDHMDQTIKTPNELKRLLNLPILGSIPKKKVWQNVLIKNIPKLFLKSNYTESYRLLCDQLRILMRYKGKKAILVTASEDQEGTSTIICNLAYYLSEHFNLKVLVVDGNLRNPSAHQLFHIKETPGLAEFLSGKTEFYQVVQKLSSNLSVMGVGDLNQDSPIILNSDKMSELIDKAKSKFDLVLIDSPDLKNYKDAVDIAAHTDGILLLVSENKTRRHVIDAVVNPSLREQFPILGTVLNRRTYAIPDFIYSRI